MIRDFFAFFFGFGLGAFAGVSVPKILSWFKAEETKVSAAAQAELDKIKTKL